MSYICLANYGASEAVYLCNVVRKILQYFRPKMRYISLENKFNRSPAGLVCMSFSGPLQHKLCDGSFIVGARYTFSEIQWSTTKSGIEYNWGNKCSRTKRHKFSLFRAQGSFKEESFQPLAIRYQSRNKCSISKWPLDNI